MYDIKWQLLKATDMIHQILLNDKFIDCMFFKGVMTPFSSSYIIPLLVPAFLCLFAYFELRPAKLTNSYLAVRGFFT